MNIVIWPLLASIVAVVVSANHLAKEMRAKRATAKYEWCYAVCRDSWELRQRWELRR